MLSAQRCGNTALVQGFACDVLVDGQVGNEQAVVTSRTPLCSALNDAVVVPSLASDSGSCR